MENVETNRTTVPGITKEEFQKLLDSHDWYYSQSDDVRKWEKGKTENDHIRRLCHESKEFSDMYDVEFKKHFGRKD